MFDDLSSTKKQGNLGVARALYEYSRLGYTVLTPLTDCNTYDIVVEREGVFQRVQVKTTSLREPKSREGVYRVIIESRGGGGKNPKVTKRCQGDYDLLFVMTVDGDCWSIPEEVITSSAALAVGTPKYQSYKLS